MLTWNDRGALRPTPRVLVVLAVTTLLVVAVGVSWATESRFPVLDRLWRPPVASPVPEPAPTATPAPDATGLQLEFSHSALRAGTSATWRFTVTNTGKETVTMTHGSGQEGDVVLRRAGAEAYRWSDCCAFTQALRERTLNPGESYSFTLSAGSLDVEPGTYAVEATVSADPAPPPHAATVEVSGEASPSPSVTPAASPQPSLSPTPQATARPRSTPAPTANGGLAATPSPTP